MTQTSLTPTRKKQLQAYIAGCKRAERRIIIGGRNRLGACLNIDHFHRQKELIKHIERCYEGDRSYSFTVALMLLRCARGRFQCELKGLSWRA